MSTSTLLMLGDSLVDYGNWRSLLPQYKVISQGRPGERTKELLCRLPSCCGHKSVDAILVMSGTNDLFTGHTDFTKEIGTITASLQESYSTAIILINSLLPIKVPGFQETICNVNRDLQGIARAAGAFYFDLYTPFVKASEPLFDFDGVHLSTPGYILWAHLLSAELSTLLAKDSD